MYQRSHIKEGMAVYSMDGEKLGKVFAIGEDSFHIEKGLFFPKDYLVRFSEISDIRGGEIILTHGKEGLQRLGGLESRRGAVSTGAPMGAGTLGLGMSIPPTGTSSMGMGTGELASNVGPESRDFGAERMGLAGRDLGIGESALHGRKDDITIPLHKEELDVVKREHQAGELRVRKEVVEEEKVMDVPVRRERARVKRRVVTDRPAVSAAFQEETVVVPLRAEEVEVHKRAMVDEEVVIQKDSVEENRRVAETVRHERVDIRGDGETDGPRKLDLTPDNDPSKRRY